MSVQYVCDGCGAREPGYYRLPDPEHEDRRLWDGDVVRRARP